MASVQGQEAGRRRRVVEVVGAYVESMTRFSAADLKELTPDQRSDADVVVTTRQRVELDLQTREGPGRLPAPATPLPDRETLDKACQQRLASAETATATAIQEWAAESPGHYRRLLPVGGRFPEALQAPLGTEWPCPTCAQRGSLPCTGCCGTGQRTCPDCQGRHRATCLDCRGLGRRVCSVCTGGDTGACAACSQGWLPCTTCAGQGERDCPRCTASGVLVCPDCQGRPLQACGDCAATGWQHRQCQLQERIEVEDRLDVHHPDPAIASAVARYLDDVVGLETRCTLDQVRYTTAPLAVQAVQRLRLPVRQARLLVAGQALTFTALGPDLAVADHQQAATVLLAHDLSTLEKNASGSGLHLGDALRRFLQSRLNHEIAIRTPVAEIARHSPGTLDEDYVRRAQAASQRAIERLWLQHARRPRLLGLAAAGLVAALAVAVGSPLLGLWSGAGIGLCTGLAGWVAADWHTRRHLAHQLHTAHGEGDRLLRPLRQTETVRRSRAVSLALVAVVALSCAAAAAQLPHVRRHHQQAQAEATLIQQLDAWPTSEAKDYRLRHYPDAATLTLALERTPHDPRLRLVRAWQLLLGTDATPPDARAAERLLANLDNDPQWGNAAVVAQARATLALRGRSASTLQTAVARLDQLPEPQPAEVHYTRALLHLAPALANRAGGPQSGLDALQHAADLGHASACFELGRRLASGHGLRRDPVAARRYLGYADTKGVPGAAQALAALR
jgi:hypothetical protein